MQANSGPVGTVEVALAHAARLLDADPALAALQAGEILEVVPGLPAARLLLARAKHAAGDAEAAVAILEPLIRLDPNVAEAHQALGLAFADLGRGNDALGSLRCAVALQPDLSEAWRAIGDHLSARGDTGGADAAYAQYVRTSTQDPRLMAAGAALCDNRIPVAEGLLRDHLKQHPTDIVAIRMLAEVAARIGRYGDATTLLERCMELAPGFNPARFNYAVVLNRENRPVESLRQVDLLLAKEPRNPAWRNLRASVLCRTGRYDEALGIYAEILREYPGQSKVWMTYGHALKTAGRRDESIAAYRRSIELEPGLGEAYWSLANLKRFEFASAEVAAMQAQLDLMARDNLSPEDRLHFHFSLGKALEDAGEWEESFRHYELGNRQRRELIHYSADEHTRDTQRSKAQFSREFFAARAGSGCAAPDPIFIVGLPRAGSTLLEQILASHSAVEGTMELPDIPMLAREISKRSARSGGPRYPEALATLDAQELRLLGERYLDQTRIQRLTGAPLFIDKMPNNFVHVGLIHLILPGAKIIDARRHPLGCGFSGFKQHFAHGQHFSYSLEDIGRYYRDYVELMAHYDEVLPGRVHRVTYETMISDTEAEIRRLLDYCGLPFEESCLRFFENDRAVRTASSEQVRRPIYREGMDHWRHFEPWLGPLKEALGPVLDAYPCVPSFQAAANAV